MWSSLLRLWLTACGFFCANLASAAAPLPLIEASPKAASAVADKPAGVQVPDQAALVGRYGTIIERRLLGAGGLTAWTVEKGGRRVVLYTTADGQAIISGIVWESMSGRNLSDQFAVNGLPNVQGPLGASYAPAAGQAGSSGAGGAGAALKGKYSGAIPESIKAVDSLVGFKEGTGGPADTLYVIYDPRCPYCRKAYTFTREYVSRGATIKWIPAIVLGNPPQGVGLAATVLQARPDQQAEALRRVLGNKEEISTPPTKATVETLERNAQFFFAAFQNNRVEQKAGVPAAFFLDKRTGKPRMMTGISEMPVIEEVFGKL